MATKKEKALLVTIEKNGGDVIKINAADVPTMDVENINAAGDVLQSLCLNLLAGAVSGKIQDAHAKKGGLTRLFPRMSEADKNALRACLDSTPAKLTAAWEHHAEKAKRIRGVSLQALARQIREKKAAEPTASLRDTLTAWAVEHADWINSKSCPVSLADILLDLLPAE